MRKTSPGILQEGDALLLLPAARLYRVLSKSSLAAKLMSLLRASSASPSCHFSNSSRALTGVAPSPPCTAAAVAVSFTSCTEGRRLGKTLYTRFLGPLLVAASSLQVCCTLARSPLLLYSTSSCSSILFHAAPCLLFVRLSSFCVPLSLPTSSACLASCMLSGLQH